MDLQLTDEQRWLQEAVDEMLTREAGPDGLVPQEAGERLWRSLVEFGALQVGSGDDALGAVELAILARSLGGRLAAVPFPESAALHYALARGGAPGAGDASAAACLSEPGKSYGPLQPETSIDDRRLTGEKTAVAYASAADVLAVPASSDDALVLVLVPVPSASAITPQTTLDPSLQLARVQFDAVDVSDVLVVAEPAAAGVVESLATVAGVLVSAEAIGAAGAVLELARDYATQRRQFGQTIGSFQAVRHLLAEMHVGVASSWSSVLYAAASLDEDDAHSLRTASIAKAYASRATLQVAHDALQVFGGIAFTAEHPAHRFLRRIAVRGSQFGTARDHERSLGRTLAQRLEVLT